MSITVISNNGYLCYTLMACQNTDGLTKIVISTTLTHCNDDIKIDYELFMSMMLPAGIKHTK